MERFCVAEEQKMILVRDYQIMRWSYWNHCNWVHRRYSEGSVKIWEVLSPLKRKASPAKYCYFRIAFCWIRVRRRGSHQVWIFVGWWMIIFWWWTCTQDWIRARDDFGGESCVVWWSSNDFWWSYPSCLAVTWQYAPTCFHTYIKHVLLLMGLNDDLILFFRPFVFADVRVQMVMPSLSALLADSAREMLGDEAPILGSMAFD